jgi:hypothetical protein
MKDNFKYILTIFFGIFYIMPIFLEMFFNSNMNNLYRLSETSIVLLIIFIFIFFSFFIYNIKLKLFYFRVFFINLFKNWILNTSSIVFLILSSYFFINYSMQFRHTGENITNLGGWIIILIALRAYFKAFLFYVLIARFKNIPLKINPILFFIIAISFILSLVSSLDIVLIILSILFFLNKEKLLAKKENSFFNLIQTVRTIILSVSLFGAIIFFGLANKVGTEKAKELVLNEDLMKITFVTTGLRLSTYYASIHGAINVVDKRENNLSKALFGALQNTINRAVYITTGEKLPRPEVWTIYRANYENLFVYNSNDRTGASPGLIASIFYGPNIVFGIMIILLYIIYIFHFLKWALRYKYKFNIFGIIICLVFVIPFLESPMDLINIFNPSFIYVYTIFAGILHLKNKSNNYVR